MISRLYQVPATRHCKGAEIQIPSVSTYVFYFMRCSFILPVLISVERRTDAITTSIPFAHYLLPLYMIHLPPCLCVNLLAFCSLPASSDLPNKQTVRYQNVRPPGICFRPVLVVIIKNTGTEYRYPWY